MDIITHTLSGMATGTVFAGLSDQNTLKKAAIVSLSGFAGAFPDIDAISLWSHFNGTIGKWFHLSLSGKEIYSAKLWYSHHGFFHSLVAAALFSFMVAYLIPVLWKHRSFKVKPFFFQQKWMLLSLFCAYTIHLLEDMPTPASTWGGVRFFWPFQVYIGGSGHIWWWNNYDIFLTVFTVLILNLALLSYFHFHRFKIKKYVSSLFLIGASFILFQTFTRRYDFAYTGNCQNYLEMESESKSIQKEILGDDLYMMMNETDRYLKVAF